MTQTGKASSPKPMRIEEAADMPERAGKCAYLGGYVDDGETICHFGDEYICRAPRFERTGNSC